MVSAGLLCLSLQALSATGISTEYQIKAAFLYNFTRFVEWPAESFADRASPIEIGAFCPGEFGDAMNRIVEGRKVNGRRVTVKMLETPASAIASHVVFVCASHDDRVAALEREVGARPVLTVGESTAFRDAEGIITFVLEGDKLRFQINSAAADRAGLKLSAQLRKLAKAVPEAP
jgi:hypothetical protein